MGKFFFQKQTLNLQELIGPSSYSNSWHVKSTQSGKCNGTCWKIKNPSVMFSLDAFLPAQDPLNSSIAKHSVVTR